MPDGLDITKDPKNIFGQLIASQIKEVQRLGKQQVQEAQQAGVPLEHIVGQIQQSMTAQPTTQQPNQQTVNQALAGQPPVQQQIQPSPTEVPPERTALFGLIRQTPSNRRQELENVLLEQEIKAGGRVGAEERKFEKEAQVTRDKRQNEFFTNILQPKPLSGEANKNLSLIETSITALDNINELLGVDFNKKTGEINIRNRKLLTNQNWLNKNRQALVRARDVFINKMLRRDSGAAITKEEEKQMQRNFGFDVGIKNFLKNPDVIIRSLVESQDQLLRDRNRFLPNENLRNFIKSEIQLGTPREDIFSFLESKGEI